MDIDKWIVPASVLGAGLLVICACLFPFYMEAHTYSKLTGKEVSTWDAIWVEFRIDCNDQ